MPHDIVITGIGAVTPAGIGREAFWEAVASGRRCFAESERAAFRGSRSRLCAAVPDIDAALDDRRFRRAADISKYALVAVREAALDAGLDLSKHDPSRTGLVMGITHGAINFTREFHSGFVKDGTAGASPVYFSDSVLNAPAGNVSIALNIKGPTHTVVGDSAAGLNALCYAMRLLGQGAADVCFTGGTEELDPVVAGAYAKLRMLSPNDAGTEDIRPFASGRNGFIIGEGACVLTLERKDAAIKRGARIYAGIARADFFAHPQKAASIADAFVGKDVLVASGANGTRESDSFEASLLEAALKGCGAMRLFSLKRLMGESFAPGGVMQAAGAAMAINASVAPPSNIGYALPPGLSRAVCSRAPEGLKIDRAVVSAAGIKGGGYILTLERPAS